MHVRQRHARAIVIISEHRTSSSSCPFRKRPRIAIFPLLKPAVFTRRCKRLHATMVFTSGDFAVLVHYCRRLWGFLAALRRFVAIFTPKRTPRRAGSSQAPFCYILLSFLMEEMVGESAAITRIKTCCRWVRGWVNGWAAKINFNTCYDSGQCWWILHAVVNESVSQSVSQSVNQKMGEWLLTWTFSFGSLILCVKV